MFRKMNDAEVSSPAFVAIVAEIAARVVLVTMSIVLSLAVLEVACRLYYEGPRALLHWQNSIAAARAFEPVGRVGGRYADDQVLGWVQRPGYATADYNTDSEGHRLNSPGGGRDPAVLALGDSLTDGDEVADGGTWPSYFESETGRRTINAGASGYGLDQIVLRAEREVASIHPVTAIVSFAPDDVRRLEFSRVWFRDKSYFDLVDGALVLKGTPVPPIADRGAMPIVRRSFGWSLLAETTADRLGVSAEWFGDEVRVLPKGRGEAIGCRLMERLASLRVPMLVVAQYDRTMWRRDASFDPDSRRQALNMLRCARQAGLATLDLFAPLRDEIVRRGLDALYARQHHTPEANRFVAHEIAGALATLQTRQELPR